MWADAHASIVGVQIGKHQTFLLIREPPRRSRLVSDDRKGEESEQNRWKAFEQKEPLPVGETETSASRTHNQTGERRADNARDRDRCQKQSGHPGTTSGGEP